MPFAHHDDLPPPAPADTNPKRERGGVPALDGGHEQISNPFQSAEVNHLGATVLDSNTEAPVGALRSSQRRRVICFVLRDRQKDLTRRRAGKPEEQRCRIADEWIDSTNQFFSPPFSPRPAFA